MARAGVGLALLAAPGRAAGPAAASPAACPAAFKIALDVGHTLSQPGATSASGVTEFTYNRRLADAVRDELTALGVAAVLIGADGAPLQLAERTRRARGDGATLFLSLHHDSVQPQYLSEWTVDGRQRRYSDRFHGYSLFVSGAGAQAAESLRFASLLGASLGEARFVPSLHHAEPIPGEGRTVLDRRLGIYRFDELAVLRTAEMPAALLEAAVIVNRQEEAEVRQPGHLKRLAGAVARAVQRFCAAAR